MDDGHGQARADGKPGEQKSAPVRKRWHTPQFMHTAIVHTDAMSGAPEENPFTQS